MKTKKDGYINAFNPYSQQEVELILSLVPTRKNCRLLAKSMGRTMDAIGMIYEVAYSTNLLKRLLVRTHGNAIGSKIVAAKQKLGLLLGHSRNGKTR